MIVFSGAPSRSLAARLITEAFWQHLVEQNFRGLMLKPPGLNRLRQIGLAQTLSDASESASCTVCTLSKIDAAV